MEHQEGEPRRDNDCKERTSDGEGEDRAFHVLSPFPVQRWSYRQRKRHKPERPSVRPTSLFFARRVIRFRLPEASVSMSLVIRALR